MARLAALRARQHMWAVKGFEILDPWIQDGSKISDPRPPWHLGSWIPGSHRNKWWIQDFRSKTPMASWILDLGSQIDKWLQAIAIDCNHLHSISDTSLQSMCWSLSVDNILRNTSTLHWATSTGLIARLLGQHPWEVEHVEVKKT